MTINPTAPELFRIWITRIHRWQPRSWQDLPTEATALELAEPDCFTALEALAYLEGHNSAALGRQDRRWAVAVPVVLTYQGEPRPATSFFHAGLPCQRRVRATRLAAHAEARDRGPFYRDFCAGFQGSAQSPQRSRYI